MFIFIISRLSIQSAKLACPLFTGYSSSPINPPLSTQCIHYSTPSPSILLPYLTPHRAKQPVKDSSTHPQINTDESMEHSSQSVSQNLKHMQNTCNSFYYYNYKSVVTIDNTVTLSSLVFPWCARGAYIQYNPFNKQNQLKLYQPIRNWYLSEHISKGLTRRGFGGQ